MLQFIALAAPPGFMTADATSTQRAAREHLQQLLAAVAGGDRDAFERLYRLTSAKLFGICVRMLPERGEAEDVLQEAYVAIWQRARGYDPALASPVTWLVAVVRNKAIDRLRAAGPRRRDVAIDAAGPLEDEGAQPLREAEAAVEGRRIEDCMNTLETRQRDAVRTAFWEGLTYEELAERLAVPLGTLKSWIRRSLLKLKVCLDG